MYNPFQPDLMYEENSLWGRRADEMNDPSMFDPAPVLNPFLPTDRASQFSQLFIPNRKKKPPLSPFHPMPYA